MKYINKHVEREYELLERFEAGIALTGSEVKSIKTRGIMLEDAFVRVIGGEVYLLNANIQKYPFTQEEDYDPKRSRRLLLHRKEILKLEIKLAQGGGHGGKLTIVPISCYTKAPKGNRIKVEIALAKGRKSWEIKKIEANRDENRRIEKDMKDYLKEKTIVKEK